MKENLGRISGQEEWCWINYPRQYPMGILSLWEILSKCGGETGFSLANHEERWQTGLDLHGKQDLEEWYSVKGQS
jgi:hypothetical protein